MDTLDDRAQNLHDRVQTAVARLGGNAVSIHVDLDGTRVTLKGGVRTWAEHEAAEAAALAVPGVDSVDNRLCLHVKGTVASS